MIVYSSDNLVKRELLLNWHTTYNCIFFDRGSNVYCISHVKNRIELSLFYVKHALKSCNSFHMSSLHINNVDLKVICNL